VNGYKTANKAQLGYVMGGNILHCFADPFACVVDDGLPRQLENWLAKLKSATTANANNLEKRL
jgi:hypothetical protein